MSVLASATKLTIAGRLQRTSLAVEAGQLIGLVGPNGSGKTSLLHAFAAIPPAAGAVAIDGADPHRLHPDKRQRLLSYLPASRDVVWPLTARNFIALALPPATDWAELAGRLDLGSFLDRRMDRLSTGQRTRVMIARALAAEPRLLLLDEPIANLDPYWQLAILNELRTVVRGRPRAVIAAIHDLSAAIAWCDRLLVMEEGQIVADGAPSELIQSGLLERVFRVPVRPADRQSLP